MKHCNEQSNKRAENQRKDSTVDTLRGEDQGPTFSNVNGDPCESLSFQTSAIVHRASNLDVLSNLNTVVGRFRLHGTRWPVVRPPLQGCLVAILWTVVCGGSNAVAGGVQFD